MPVSHFARRRLAVLAALTLGLAACSDSSAPDAPYDAAGTSADIATVQNAFSSPVVASYTAISSQLGAVVGGSASAAVAAMPSGGLTSRAGTFQFARQLSAKLQPRSENGPSFSTSSIPAQYAGKTFEYDLNTQQYVATDRTGAPADGIRFILYAIDPITHQPAAPLNEVGYVQLTASESGASASAHLTVVATPSNVTYFDYTLDLSFTSTSATLAISGFATNGTDQVTFDLSGKFLSNQTLVFTSVLAVPTSGFRLETAATFDFNASTATLSIVARGPHGRVSLTGSANATTGNESYTVRVNGDLFATITVTSSSTTYLDANGQPLGADDLDTLQKIYEMLAGSESFFETLVTPTGMF